jgi:hypothetical protein
MFPITRVHRQVGATLLLVATSVFPTLLVLTHVLNIIRPGHVRDVEVELGRLLDADIAIERVRHPRPGELELVDVSIRSRGASAARELLRCDRLVALTEREALTLQIDGLTLQQGQAAAAIDQLDAYTERLLRHYRRVGLIANRAALERETSPALVLDDLAVVLEQKSGSRQISSSFRMASGKHRGRHELTIVDSPANPAHRRVVSMATREGGLSLAALAGVADVEAWFGPDAHLEGEMTWTRPQATGDWTLQMKGQIHDVDLRCVAAHFPNTRFEGRGTLDLDDARWGPFPSGQGTGWVEVRGRLRCGPGLIGRPLMEALAREMRFGSADLSQLPGESDTARFETFALAFELSSDGGLRLNGASDVAPGVVATAATDQKPLLTAPEGASTVHALWKALFPLGGDVLVPATQDTRLMRHLPLPTSHSAGASPIRAN